MNSIFFIFLIANIMELIFCDTSCKPRLTLERNEKKNPYYHEVYRCSGHSESSHFDKRCVNTSYNYLQIKLKNLEYPNEPETIKLVVNHTSCDMKCVCNCVREEKHPFICEEGFLWSNVDCACKPICTNTNKHTREEQYEKGVSATTLIVAMIAEFFIVLIAVLLGFDICKCKKDSTGVLYGAAKYIKCASGEKHRRNTEYNKSGSVSILHDLNT